MFGSLRTIDSLGFSHRQSPDLIIQVWCNLGIWCGVPFSLALFKTSKPDIFGLGYLLVWTLWHLAKGNKLTPWSKFTPLKRGVKSVFILLCYENIFTKAVTRLSASNLRNSFAANLSQEEKYGRKSTSWRLISFAFTSVNTKLNLFLSFYSKKPDYRRPAVQLCLRNDLGQTLG